MYEYKAEITRVVDGDTLDLTVDLGFRMYARIRVRLARIDTWEIRGDEYEKGILARKSVRGLVNQYGSSVRVVTGKDTGKYGRWIGDIWFEDGEGGEINLTEWLLAEGHGVPYPS